jgi:RNA polymerase sigma-70 factor, ECF subfamily
LAHTVTVLLQAWRRGETSALEQLMPLVYDELHRIAGIHARRERSSRALQATELVSEAYVRFVRDAKPEWQDRVQFFGIASHVMRQILNDDADKRNALKRGGGQPDLEFEDDLASGERPAELKELDAAIRALGAEYPDEAKVVDLYYVRGHTQAEVAEQENVHPNTVANHLRFAETWIKRYFARDQRK